MNLLGFLRHVRYDKARDIALVQTGSRRLVAAAAGELPAVFPGCVVHAILRDELTTDEDGAGLVRAAHVEVVSPGQRAEAMARLRRKRFDVIAIELTSEPLGDLAWLAFGLRARSMIAFNANVDHFPVNVHRLTTLAEHFGFSGAGSGGAWRALVHLGLRVVGRVLATAAAGVFLSAAALRLRIRGGLRRILRGRP